MSGKCSKSWRVCITWHPTGGTQPRGVGQGMTLRCRQVYKEINRRVEIGSFPSSILAPPPSLAHVVPSLGTAMRGAQGQSRPPGAGHPPSLFKSWHRTSLPQGQGVKRLAGNWWETGWHLPPPHQVGKIRCASKCQGDRAKEEVIDAVKSLHSCLTL